MLSSSRPSGTEQEEATTIHQSLSHAITTVVDSAKKAQIISINASILASGSTNSQTIAGFQVVAEEIHNLSTSSLQNISSLKHLLAQLKSVSSTLNKAGRQRMLAQKALKLHLAKIQSKGSSHIYNEQFEACVNLFENSIRELKGLEINTPEIDRQLAKAEQIWKDFIDSLRTEDLDRWTQLNDLVVTEMNTAVELYESLIG